LQKIELIFLSQNFNYRRRDDRVLQFIAAIVVAEDDFVRRFATRSGAVSVRQLWWHVDRCLFRISIRLHDQIHVANTMYVCAVYNFNLIKNFFFKL